MWRIRGKRFNCSFLKKEGGAIEHFAAFLLDITNQACLVHDQEHRSPSYGAWGMQGGEVNPLQKIISPQREHSVFKKFFPCKNFNLLHQHTAVDVDYLTGNVVGVWR